MWVTSTTLEGRKVRLDPLTAAHAEALYELAEDDVFRFMGTRAKDPNLESFLGYLRVLTDSGKYCPFVVLLHPYLEPVGVSTFMDIHPENRGLEIGATWLARKYWGSGINTEMKYLMLRHAFERLGALRVQIKTDSRNIRSQRAIEKLGAYKEGVLRKHMVMPDGYVRDTVMYSLTDDDWPAVKARLEQTLGYVP